MIIHVAIHDDGKAEFTVKLGGVTGTPPYVVLKIGDGADVFLSRERLEALDIAIMAYLASTAPALTTAPAPSDAQEADANV